MTTIDRLAEGYVPQFDIDAEYGRQGELLVLDIIQALKTGSVEVKTDARALDTGNVYVEYQCKGRPSGISTTQTEVWVFVVGDIALAVPTERLRQLARHYYRDETRRAARRVGSHPTRGVLVPLVAFTC